jgi:MFS family permease
MIRNFIYLFVRRTHFWRHAGFSELAELYSSRMLRVLAMQMIGGFSAIYLYQLGYNLIFIAWYFLFYFSFRFISPPFIALLVARVGPKHGTLISNVLYVFSAIALVLVPQYGLAALIIYVPLGGFSRSLYDICFLVDFSKVKQVEHAGKELGIMQVVERVMTAVSPIAGGLVALWFGPQVMLVVAALMMAFSAWPLFFSDEPIKVHQKITLHHFNFKVTWRPILANIGVGFDNNASGFLWSLFIAITLLDIKNNDVYVQLGALSSVSLLVSILVAYLYGKVVDRHHGRILLRISVIADALVHLARPFVQNPGQVVALNAVNEVATTGYVLPAMRGVFDTADGLPGYRIVYISILEAMLSLGDMIMMGLLIILVGLFGEKHGLKNLYFVVAPLVLLILFHARAVYRRGILTKFIHRV